MTTPDPATKFRLSKSKIAAFEHCPKRLWLQVHRREEAHFEEDTLRRFTFGHGVGEQACKQIPEGVMVEAVPDIQAALNQTAMLLTRQPPVPIFEATFQHEDVLVRVDVLQPDGQGGWIAVEVKATSRVRSYHLADLATQIWVMRGCGVKLSAAFIRHVAGRINWEKLDASIVCFTDTDVSQMIEAFIAGRQDIVEQARKIVRSEQPGVATGIHCLRPFSCEFLHFCRKRWTNHE